MPGDDQGCACPVRPPSRTTIAQRAALALMVLVAAIVGLVAPADAESRIALVITNQAYTQAGAALTNTHRDGDLVKAALERVGFKVTVVRDTPNEAALLSAFGAHVQRLAEAGPDAVGFVYYSGHGAADRPDGANYLIPTSAPITHAAQLPLMAVRLDKITETLARVGRINFVVFDACRNVPLQRAEKDVSFKGWAPVKEQSGLLLAYATEPGNVAVDQSIYARALAEEIVQPGREASSAFRAVARRVIQETANKQAPQYLDRRLHDFEFAALARPPEPGPPPQITPVPAPPAAAPQQPPQIAAPSKSVVTPPQADAAPQRQPSGHTAGVESVAVSSDGAVIVTGSTDGTARVWDGNTYSEVSLLKGHRGRVMSVAMSGDGNRIVYGSQDGSARVWGRKTERSASVWEKRDRSFDELAVLNASKSEVLSIALSADGSRIVIGSENGTTTVWDGESYSILGVLKGHLGSVEAVAVSADGSRIVTGSSDKTLHVWDGKSFAELAVLRGHSDTVGSVAISFDGARIISGSGDRTARVWDAVTGAEIAVLKGHKSLLWGVALSADGARIITGSADATVRVWDGKTFAEIAVIEGHKRGVTSVAISADGLRIVTGSEDRTARVWDGRTYQQTAVLGHSPW